MKDSTKNNNQEVASRQVFTGAHVPAAELRRDGCHSWSARVRRLAAGEPRAAAANAKASKCNEENPEAEEALPGPETAVFAR